MSTQCLVTEDTDEYSVLVTEDTDEHSVLVTENTDEYSAFLNGTDNCEIVKTKQKYYDKYAMCI